MSQRHRGRRTRDPREVVVLGHPKPPVAERLDMARQVERITQRLPGAAAFDDRGKIENRERDHRVTI